MSTSKLSVQSALARRSAEAELRRLLANFAPTHQRLIGTMRRWLRKRLPTAHELVYEYRDFFVISYSPSERGYEGVLAFRASENGVRLYFNRGKELPDPAASLQGSGNQARWIHAYHNGTGRDIWKRFSTNNPEKPLAHAIAAGLVATISMPVEVPEHIAPMVEFSWSESVASELTAAER